jgi:hypothetical protein
MDKIKAAIEAARTWADEHRKATAVIVAFVVGVIVGGVLI